MPEHADTPTTDTRQASARPSAPLTPDTRGSDTRALGSQQAGPEPVGSSGTQPPGPSGSQHMDPRQARELLRQADHLGNATAAGAGTPPALFLLGLGSLSSMMTVANYLAVLTDERLSLLPLVVFLTWLAILIATIPLTTRATRLGFSRRWAVSMASWATVWAVTCFGGNVIWKGELWFTVLAVLALTAVTVWGARREVR